MLFSNISQYLRLLQGVFTDPTMLSTLVADGVASILCLCVVHYVLITMQSALVVYVLFFVVSLL